jgi:PIN domain nuclease of toxin-antitoxin system
MALLLDTHAFIWWADAPERLPDKLVARLILAGVIEVA